MDFCKIFNVGKSQVLIINGYDDEDEQAPYYISQICEYVGVRADIKIKFANESKANKAFKEYKQENAESVLNSVKSFIEDNS